MENKEIVEHWVKTSDKDFITMIHLYETEDYSWALFIGHLVIEKLLKAIYVKNIDTNVLFTHDLLRLAIKAKLNLIDEQKDFLDTVTSFNIMSRYDNYKMEFYNKCTKDFCALYIEKIKEFREWIKQRL